MLTPPTQPPRTFSATVTFRRREGCPTAAPGPVWWAALAFPSARTGSFPSGMAYVLTARHLLRAKDLVDARYFEPLSVDDLARVAGLSRAHFSREFRGRVRRVATRLPADAPARASCGAAAHDRPLCRRYVLLGRPSEPRFVHDELHAHVRDLPDRVPREVSARRGSSDGALVRAPRLRPPATPHV